MGGDTIWIFVGLAGLGCTLLALGWRGRRVGDHPVCLGCGFDLFAQPEGSTACPECGRNLSKPHSTAIGAWQLRRGLAAVGGVLFVPSIAAIGMIGWAQYKHINWDEHKPTRWLIQDASRAGNRDAYFALTILNRRLTSGELSRAQVAELVERALKAQIDEGRQWNPVWGNIFERARAAGDVTDEQWQRYGEQSLTNLLSLSVRTKVRRGDAMPYRLMAGLLVLEP